MALDSMRQFLDHAAKHGYGVAVLNLSNPEPVQAMMQAASETASPVIVQGSAGARKYVREPCFRHLIVAAKPVCKARFDAFGIAGTAEKIKPVVLESMAKRYAAGGDYMAKAA